MKSYTDTIEKEDWKGSIPMLLKRTVKNRTWTKVKFRELSIYDHLFENCQFIDCEFQHCNIGNDVKYKNCLWKNCTFWGQYSSLGGKGIYDDCRFENMVIKNGLWDNVYFKNCYFSGKMINAYWEGVWSDSGKAKLTFHHCDMRETVFENVTIKNGVDFSTTQLPKKSLRLFNNNKSQFSNAFVEVAQSNLFDKDVSIALKIIGDFAVNQHPVILDDKHLDNYPGPISSEKRLAFEQIAAAFEIKREE